VQDVWQDVTFTLDIKNIATGTNSGIALATTWNYAVDIRFTDKDLALYTATVTNSKTFVYKPSAANAANLKAGMAVGSTLSLGGTVRVALEKAKCNDLKYICAIIQHNALLYGDKDKANNKKCIDISAVKVCSPGKYVALFAREKLQHLNKYIYLSSVHKKTLWLLATDNGRRFKDNWSGNIHHIDVVFRQLPSVFNNTNICSPHFLCHFQMFP
jgi:hypothetical protein